LNRIIHFVVFSVTFLLMSDMLYAAPIIYRQQQEKAMRQQQAQMEYQLEYQRYLAAQQGQQQGGDQSQGQGAAHQPTYQETIDHRNQAIAQAIQDAHHESTLTSSSGQGPSSSVDGPKPVASSGGGDTVDLVEVWKKLDKKSTVWKLLIDDQSKILTVSEYLDRFHKEGVRINAPPAHYVQSIDQMIAQSPKMLEHPFGELIQIAAIVDYDFDNGMNKDDLARKVLGEEGFEMNKKRFTQQ